MIISPHLLIDAVILSSALTITLVLRAKVNATRKEKDSKWLLRKTNDNSKNLNLSKIWRSLVMEVLQLHDFSKFTYIPPIYM